MALIPIELLVPWLVTPSRVCELKCINLQENEKKARHTLTGVWVEMQPMSCFTPLLLCHTLTGVWVEMVGIFPIIPSPVSHPHGCVSWNFALRLFFQYQSVTPSRVCEMKYQYLHRTVLPAESHPHGCVSWNLFISAKSNERRGHTLTGVWVEILNLRFFIALSLSHPHGCVSWNKLGHNYIHARVGHTLTGVWVEI